MSYKASDVPKTAFNVSDKVDVRCDEAGLPPSYAAVVCCVNYNFSHGAVEYTVIDEDGFRFDGYSGAWLSART